MGGGEKIRKRSIKLAYIANARIPSEKAHPYQILKMCEAFKKNNITIELIVPIRIETQRKMKQIKDIWKYYAIERKFKMKKLPSFDLIWTIQYYPSMPRLASLVFHLQDRLFASFATFYSLFNEAKVYYTRDYFFAFLFGSLKFLHKRKIYYEAHKCEPLISRLLRKGKMDGLIVITHKLKELYIKEGVTEEKILVAPDGVDLRMFNKSLSKEQARGDLNLPQEKIVGYVGQLHTMGMEKGTSELIEAFRILKEQTEKVILCFVGGPEGRIQRYADAIKRKELQANVIFIGQKPPYEIPLYLKAFDVCVMPFPWTQHYAYYMSPLKLFEYMTSKRPIVASDLPTIREVLNEENAVLVEPENPEALAEGIEKVLNDEKLANKLAEKAYEDVQQYIWEKRAERILKFIGEKL